MNSERTRLLLDGTAAREYAFRMRVAHWFQWPSLSHIRQHLKGMAGLVIGVLMTASTVVSPVPAQVAATNRRPGVARKPTRYVPKIRRYFIAAEPVKWNYMPVRDSSARGNMRMMNVPQNNQEYAKYRYFQYTDDTFTKRVPQPAWLGILGPFCALRPATR